LVLSLLEGAESDAKLGAERGLGKADLVPGERGEIVVPSRALGQPGPAELEIQFAGSATVLPSSRKAVITRTALVNVEAPPHVDADHRGEATLVVGLTSVAGKVPSGTIEVRVQETTVGIASVSDGEAHVPVRLGAELFGAVQPGGDRAEQHSARVEVRYLPSAPWWRAGPPEQVDVFLAPVPAWYRLPWLIAGALVAAWLVLSLRRPASYKRAKTDDAPQTLPRGKSEVEVIRAYTTASGWQGHVRDAHDGTPIAAAKLHIHFPSFADDEAPTPVVTDDEGAFDLHAPDARRLEGARLIVRAPWHTSLERPVPAAGELAIHLVSRKRELLSRLVQWAQRGGKRWRARGEPTPGDVAGRAEEQRRADVASWARAVEEAAYGPELVDAAREQDVRDQEPV
jgi:hypothetical protein